MIISALHCVQYCMWPFPATSVDEA